MAIIGSGLMAKAHTMAWRNVQTVYGDVPVTPRLGDLGAHVIAIARFLIGDIAQVASLARIVTKEALRLKGENEQ